MAISKIGAPVGQKPLVSGGGDVRTASKEDIDKIVVTASDVLVEKKEDDEGEDGESALA